MELTGAITNTLFLTFLHNQYAIGFLLGAIVSLGLLIIRPSRYAVFLLIGFIILLLGFEYNKHIIEPLQDQTLSSLNLSEDDASAKLLLVRTFQKLLPLAFFTFGWGSIFLALLIKGFFNKGATYNDKEN